MISAAAIAAAALLTPASAGPGTACPARDGTFVHWVDASNADERAALDRWCAGVGGPLRLTAVEGARAMADRFAVVTWNTHVGAADVDRFVADLRGGRLTDGVPVRDFVLLLQEVYRAGREVPGRDLRALSWASAQRPVRAPAAREDILAIATRLRLDTVYIPSMRNGAPLETDEDRGNAILATVPLSHVTAIELPLERQRRVAVQAVVQVEAADGEATPVTLVNTHFTNMVMHHLWVLSESGRLRQARALARAMPPAGPLIVGGDFNAWFGFRDAAYREIAKVARPAASEDRRASFGPMRLDHLLFRLPGGWTAALRRADDRYGSDHYPLIATIRSPH
jgi:endonuclease/exonuclease/phosphatase family metal-dependent hydrolase